MMRAPAGITLALATIMTSVLLAQGRGVPPPANAPSATGDGLILGHVVDGSTGKPIPNAVVAITLPVSASTPASAAVFKAQTVIVGTDGAFVFRDLPAGRFSLRASFSGYIGPEGNTQTFQTVTLSNSEKVNGLDIPLWRSGAITGQVVDEAGEGVEGIAISLFRIASMAGPKTFVPTYGFPTTDDRGVYRFGSIAPGDYVVCALFSRHTGPLSSNSGSGYRLGNCSLISGSGSRNVDPAPDEAGRQSSYADACYSSASGPAAAQVISLESGQERSQVNLLLRVVPSVSIYGTMTGPADQLHGSVRLYTVPPDDVSLANVPEAGLAEVDASGRFAFMGVTPGSYTIRAIVNAPQSTPPASFDFLSNSWVERPREIPSQRKPVLWASAPVVVGDKDVSGITLTLREAARVTGRIVFDGTTPQPASRDLTSSRVRMIDVSPMTGLIGLALQENFSEDGRFTVEGVMPGRYLLQTMVAFQSWTLKSIIADGRDVSDEPLEISGSDVTGVVVTMSDRPTMVSGVVHGTNDAPDRRSAVAIFPADRGKWLQPVSGRRWTVLAVSQRGEFSTSTLIAGDYLAVAVPDRLTIDWKNRQLLDALAQAATRLTLRDGDRQVLTLQTKNVR